MVIGGFVGLGMWRCSRAPPGVPRAPAPFIVVGMIACFGSIAHAPLGLMLMVAEMTGSLSCCRRRWWRSGSPRWSSASSTIYESQLEVAPTRPRIAPLRAAASELRHGRRCDGRPHGWSFPTATPTMSLSLLGRTSPARPVIEGDGASSASSACDVDIGPLPRRSAADPTYPSVQSDQGLDFALDAMVSAGIDWVPVIATARRRDRRHEGDHRRYRGRCGVHCTPSPR